MYRGYTPTPWTRRTIRRYVPYIQTTLVGLTLVMAVALDKGIQKAVSRSVAQNARRRQRRNGQTSSQDIERTEQATADVKE